MTHNARKLQLVAGLLDAPKPGPIPPWIPLVIWACALGMFAVLMMAW